MSVSVLLEAESWNSRRTVSCDVGTKSHPVSVTSYLFRDAESSWLAKLNRRRGLNSDSHSRHARAAWASQTDRMTVAGKGIMGSPPLTGDEFHLGGRGATRWTPSLIDKLQHYGRHRLGRKGQDEWACEWEG